MCSACQCRFLQRQQPDEIQQQVTTFLATPLSFTQWLKGCGTGIYYLTFMKYFNPEKYELAKYIHEELIKQQQKRE